MSSNNGKHVKVGDNGVLPVFPIFQDETSGAVSLPSGRDRKENSVGKWTKGGKGGNVPLNQITNVHTARKVSCEICHKWLHPNGVRRHIQEIHGENQSVKCDICGKTFRNKSSLQDHLRQIHNVYKNKVAD